MDIYYRSKERKLMQLPGNNPDMEGVPLIYTSIDNVNTHLLEPAFFGQVTDSAPLAAHIIERQKNEQTNN